MTWQRIMLIQMILLIGGISLLQLQQQQQQVDATTNTTSTVDSLNISTSTEFFDRTGECLVLDSAEERNDCFDQIIEDKAGQ